MYNRILEETGKQFLKRFLQGAAVELSANLIVKGIETAFELYKQRKFMELNVEYADYMQQQQMLQEQQGYVDEEDPETDFVEPEIKPKRKPRKKKA